MKKQEQKAYENLLKARYRRACEESETYKTWILGTLEESDSTIALNIGAYCGRLVEALGRKQELERQIELFKVYSEEENDE